MHLPSRLTALTILTGFLLCRSGAASPQTPDELLAKGREAYQMQGPTAALPLFEKALSGYRAAGDRRGEATTLGLVGNCQKRLGNLDAALALLREALKIQRDLGDRVAEGKTLSHLGLVFWEKADYPEAIRHLEEAAAIGREAADARLEGSALNNLGLVYDETGDYTKSLAQYRRALELYRRVDFPRGEGDTLGNIGGVNQMLGRFHEALRYYRQALAISSRLGSKPAMSQDLGNIALCHAGLGDFADAIADYDRALALAREAGLKKEEADWLRGKGALLVENGRHSEGLGLVRASLARYEASGLRRERVEALQQIAQLELQLGDVAAAEESLRRSLVEARAIGNPRGVFADLVALGELERRRHRPKEAEAFFREALAGALGAGDRNLEASCRVRFSALLTDERRFPEARDEALKGLQLAEHEGAKLLAAEARFAAGDAELGLGDRTAALEQFGAGETLVEKLAEPDVAWRLAHGRGRALERLGRDEEAVKAYRRAVDLIETVRGRLREEKLRAGYVEDRSEAYVDLVRLLLRRGREDEAFSTAERMRASSYLDILSRGAEPGLTPAQRETAAGLKQRIRTLEKALDTEWREPGRDHRQAAEIFSTELAAAERDYQTYLAGLRTADPGLAATWSLAVPPAAAIRAALPRDAALIEYVVGRTEAMVFVLTSDRLRAHVAPLLRRDLAAKVALVRDLVLRPRSDWRSPAASLAGSLVEPLEKAGWLSGKPRLYLVPHDVLHHLPFALLPHGAKGRLLVQDHDLTFLPAAGSLVLPRETRSPPGTVLAMAPRVARLRHANEEARAVVAAHREPRSLLLGAAATESAFKKDAAGFRVLHLATHSRFNRLNPLLSRLELEASGADDGHLEVHEILGLRLEASLVTLSACETGLGSDFLGSVPAGDDFVGMTRAFLHAGSGAVLASLWEVDDRSTLELMRAFYARLASANPASALASAQRQMLAGRDPQLIHPYHWAPFVLVGEAPVKKTTTTGQPVSVKDR